MSFSAFLRYLLGNPENEHSGWDRRPRSRRRLANQRSSFPARLEALEGRLAPATWTVTNTLDDGSTGTLRWAIIEAVPDLAPTPLINFAVPPLHDAAGNLAFQNVALRSPLPGLTR